MNYQPGPIPVDHDNLREFIGRELRRVSDSLQDKSATVFYRTTVDTPTLTATTSANYKASFTANILRVSTSNTVTLTGITDRTPYRERIFINVGTGVLVLKSEASESSASNRFALPATWQLSANATATLWRDPISSRHRGIGRT